jgi:hypothetical protein
MCKQPQQHPSPPHSVQHTCVHATSAVTTTVSGALVNNCRAAYKDAAAQSVPTAVCGEQPITHPAHDSVCPVPRPCCNAAMYQIKWLCGCAGLQPCRAKTRLSGPATDKPHLGRKVTCAVLTSPNTLRTLDGRVMCWRQLPFVRQLGRVHSSQCTPYCFTQGVASWLDKEAHIVQNTSLP